MYNFDQCYQIVEGYLNSYDDSIEFESHQKVESELSMVSVLQYLKKERNTVLGIDILNIEQMMRRFELKKVLFKQYTVENRIPVPSDSELSPREYELISVSFIKLGCILNDLRFINVAFKIIDQKAKKVQDLAIKIAHNL